MSEREIHIGQKDIESLNKPPFCCKLTDGNNSVNLFTELPHLYTELSRSNNAYVNSIPSWHVNKDPGESPHSINIIESDAPGLVYNDVSKTLYAFGDPDTFKDGQSIAWLSYWLMEAQRQKDSSFTMHSSALTLNNKGVLLLGHSGSGKTSLMLDLCRKYNGEVISNDLTIVHHDKNDGQMMLVDGTKEIRLRLTTASRNFPDLEHIFPVDEISPWDNKVAVMPEELGIGTQKGQQKLDAIFEIHLDSDINSNLSIQPVKGIGIKYRLYEDMSRIVRASAISVFGNTDKFLGYIPPIDSEELHNNRVACIDYMTNNMGVVNISGGNLQQVTNAVITVLNST